MAAANITAKYDMTVQHLVPDIMILDKVTQSDWFSYTKAPGILVLSGTNFAGVADTCTSTFETPTYGSMKANGAVASTTTTSVIYDTATGITRLLPYYVLNATTGEMMFVTADTAVGGAAGTLTVRRGVLGTTATVIADNAPLYVMNQIFLGAAAVGKVILMVYPLPNEPGAKLFSEQRES